MRVLVCGARNWDDRARVYGVLDDLKRAESIDAVIEGDARGVDRMAGYWARKNRIDDIKYPANWDLHGNAAGPIRNQEMLDFGKPDLVIAFPLKDSVGTWDMVRRAKAAGVKTIIVQ